MPAARPVTDPELARTLGDIEQLITERTHALVTSLLHRPPAWAVPLGPPPRDNAARRAWLDLMAVVAGYRDLHQIHHDQRPLGDTDDRHPNRGDDRLRATAAVATAARLARSHPAATSAATEPPTRSRSIHR